MNRSMRHSSTQEITDIILQAKQKAYKETDTEPEPELTQPAKWPITSSIGPGLEGAIACETEVGYVNGRKGWLVYRGYNVFDLCAYSTFEEVSFLLLFGHLPSADELADFNNQLIKARELPNTIRLMMGVPIQDMNPMAALRDGINMLRLRLNWKDMSDTVDPRDIIYTDEDAIPQEDRPKGENKAIYEFEKKHRKLKKPEHVRPVMDDGESITTCINLISAMSVLTAAISRIRTDHIPVEWSNELSHAGNLLYMITGRIPTPVEERIMDINLILHADHGMNASTFASMVVASSLSDIYLSVEAGIAALNGPLHGGANEAVLKMLKEIGSPENIDSWYADMQKQKKKIMGFGHRVYKAYDPRARILAPLAEYMTRDNPTTANYLNIAKGLEEKVIATLGKEKQIFPNVDYYSGIVYSSMGIPDSMFTPIFAVSRTSGWTARILEYIENNRIFRPRAMYTGDFKKNLPLLANR